MAQTNPGAGKLLDRSLPWWTWPAQMVAWLRTEIRLSTIQDVELLSRLRMGWMPVVVTLVAMFFAIARSSVVGVPAGDSPFVIQDVYIESMLFMSVALLIGFLAPTVGILFLVVYGLLDLVLSRNSSVTAIAGRLVAYWLLGLLIVEVPRVYRALVRATAEWTFRRAGKTVAMIMAVLAGAAVSGVLVAIWTQAVPLLIRPVFIWAGYYSPSTQAIAPLQKAYMILVVWAVILALGWPVLRARLKLDDEGASIVTQNEPRLALSRLARRLLTIALLVFMLGGMITSPLDVAILLAALGGAGPLARLVLRIRLLNTILGTIPIAVRFVLGCFLALAVANAVTSINIYPWPSDFFPVVVATALDVLIFVILLGAWREPIQRMAVSRTPGTTVKTLVLAISLAVLWLGLPEQVYADNCSSLDDQCSAGPPGCTSAAAAALAAGYAWWKGHNKGDRDPNTDDTEGDDDSIPESCPK